MKLSTVFGVMLAALAIFLALRLFLSSTLDPLLIQAVGAVVLLALPLLAMRQAGAIRLPARPTRAAAVFAVLIGLLASVAGAWLLSVVNGLLVEWIGTLPSTLPTAAGAPVVLLVDGLLTPLARGVLFWVFVQRGTAAIGHLRAAWLVAFLFAGANVLTGSGGISAGAAALPLGIGAAMIAAFSGNAWTGVIACVAWDLANLLLPPYLLGWLGINALSLNWAAAALLGLFGIFFALQVAQARFAPPEEAALPRAGSLLRQPFLWLYGALVGIAAVLELFLRSRPA